VERADERKSKSEDGKDVPVSKNEYGLGIGSGTNSLGRTERSDDVSGSTNKADQNVCNVRAKDVGVDAKSMETASVTTHSADQWLSAVWGSYILAVQGIPPYESGVSFVETVMVYISVWTILVV
jgi:hypothetical protein